MLILTILPLIITSLDHDRGIDPALVINKLHIRSGSIENQLISRSNQTLVLNELLWSKHLTFIIITTVAKYNNLFVRQFFEIK